MISMSLSELAQATNGAVHGANVQFGAVSSDTRSLQSGDLFIALSGPNFDGHDYVAKAAELGASAAMVERVQPLDLPQLAVADARLGLGHAAAAWRARASATVLGITGSNGKTTLKEMLSAILAVEHSVLFTRGNLNNDIGMPLTLLRLQDEAYAVIEMGANHAGEIAYLSNIARPDIAVLNNAGRAHLEGFGSLEGVAQAKGEIIQGLGPDGIFICNGDDRFAPLWRDLAKAHRVIDFAVQHPAQVHSPADSLRVEWGEHGFSSVFDVETAQAQFSVTLQLVGEHNRMNALAAIAAVSSLDVSVAAIQQGLASLAPVPGRLAPLAGIGGARLIDDSYNANPDSVAAALQVLKGAPGRRTLVMGDLGELGPEQQALHAGLGQQAMQAGIDRVISCGQLSAATSEAFSGASQHFVDQQALIDFLAQDLSAEDSVLVKGSRASAMDKVVRALTAEASVC